MALRLLAVDPSEAVIREDGFLFEETPAPGILKRLTVASLLPPNNAKLRNEEFIRNIYRVKGEQAPPFCRPKNARQGYGLETEAPKEVLAAVFEMHTDGSFTEKLSVEEAVITPLSYEEFTASEDFDSLKKGVEDFLTQDPHTWYRYKTLAQERNWEDDSPARRLIAGMIDLFNNICSYYALRQRIETVGKKGVEITYRVNTNVSTFNAPMRKAEGFVNSMNLVAYMKQENPPYTKDWLVQLGVDLR